MSTFIHDPGGLPYKIEQLYAFISTDEFGSEGVIGFATNGVFMPLVGADMDRVESLRPIAQHVANQTQKQVRLCRFALGFLRLNLKHYLIVW